MLVIKHGHKFAKNATITQMQIPVLSKFTPKGLLGFEAAFFGKSKTLCIVIGSDNVRNKIFTK